MAHPGNKGIVWRKAAVLGSIWAASEIVLGSFLHNASIPFKGELLTAIGIAIMVAGHRLWPEKGLLWRSGLVCAAMKSVSPSAVIFGPMVAISMEGFLAEAGVRCLGGNLAGYSLAGGLAMTWAILHKAGNLYIFYGPDTVRMYLRGLGWLRSIGLAPGNLWVPLVFLLSAYFLGGMFAAAMGMRAGKKIVEPDALPLFKTGKRLMDTATEGKYSIAALISHLALMAAVMAAGKKIPMPALCAGAAAYAAACSFFYPRAGALARRFGVWAGVLAVSLFAGLLIGSISSGLYMAVRAFVLTFGFSAVGSELMNPRIRSWLERRGGGVFFETLEYAFSALPGIISALPSGREMVRRPVTSLNKVISTAPFWLDAIRGTPVFIITGKHGGGKSELVRGMAGALGTAGKKPGGIMAEGFWEGKTRAGFDLVDLSSGSRFPLCRRGPGGGVRAGEFHFFDEGLAAGLAALSGSAVSGADAVFVDEIGFLELEGKGWAGPLRELLTGARPVVLVVRDYLVDRVTAHFELGRPVIWKAGSTNPSAAAAELLAAASENAKNG